MQRLVHTINCKKQILSKLQRFDYVNNLVPIKFSTCSPSIFESDGCRNKTVCNFNRKLCTLSYPKSVFGNDLENSKISLREKFAKQVHEDTWVDEFGTLSDRSEKEFSHVRLA